MLNLEQAIERAFWKCNEIGENCEIWDVIYRYKAIRELPETEQDKVYEQIAARMGFCR